MKVRRKYGIIKAWKNIDGAVGNTNVCRVNNGLQPINKRLKEQLIVTAMKKDDFTTSGTEQTTPTAPDATPTESSTPTAEPSVNTESTTSSAEQITSTEPKLSTYRG